MPIDDALTFSDANSAHVSHPHDDALVIALRIGEFNIKRVLINTCTSPDILFYDAFSQDEAVHLILAQVHTPLVGFIGQSIIPKGTITLPLTLGKGDQYISKVEFMVVGVPSLCNAIFYWHALNSFKYVTSTCHLKMKFPTPNESG